jgi:hypothetical protein
MIKALWESPALLIMGSGAALLQPPAVCCSRHLIVT